LSEDGRCAEEDGRESGDDKGFRASGISIRYFDASDIYDQEEEVAYEQAEKECEEKAELMNIMGEGCEEYRPQTTTWSFSNQKRPLGFT
jgi:hypothetical protein